MHYGRWKTTGDPGQAQRLRSRTPDGLCTISDCGAPHEGHGLCVKHLARFKTTGDPNSVKLVMGDPLRRFHALCRPSGDGCWRWTGYLESNGYARFTEGARRWGAHRWSYEHFVGPIPQGWTIDHLCRVRCCVNPEHLQAVPHAVNNARAPGVASTRNAVKTHCRKGHQFDMANTYVGSRNGRTYRECRTCHREKERRRRAA